MDDQRIPSHHLEDKFKVVGVLPGEVIWRKEKIDLRTITLEKAEEIHKQGFPYLQPVLIAPRIKEKKAEETSGLNDNTGE